MFCLNYTYCVVPSEFHLATLASILLLFFFGFPAYLVWQLWKRQRAASAVLIASKATGHEEGMPKQAAPILQCFWGLPPPIYWHTVRYTHGDALHTNCSILQSSTVTFHAVKCSFNKNFAKFIYIFFFKTLFFFILRPPESLVGPEEIFFLGGGRGDVVPRGFG